MEVKLAECAGFCFGVKRAVDTVYNKLNSDKHIYTFGPIVHNEEVVSDLESKGVGVIENEEALSKIKGDDKAVVIIRAHGVPEKTYKEIEKCASEVIDATCPFVKKIHRIVEKESLLGKRILITGNPEHPEVIGIIGWCRGPVEVISSIEDAQNYIPPDDNEICLVSQTTFSIKKFQDIIDIFKDKRYNVVAMNTICNATEERQLAARSLAHEADAMIVIGGKNSSNTRKLYEICNEECEYTYYIQTLDDLNLELPKSVKLVGITAGASTPQNIIEEVQKHVRDDF